MTTAQRHNRSATSRSLAEHLFGVLDSENIRWCIWKESFLLKEGLDGKEDMDILVEKRSTDATERILKELRFKRVVRPNGARLPGIEQWIGFDENSGKFVYLDMHFQLIAGIDGIKGHRLPWEVNVLNSRRRHSDFPVWSIDPNLEIVLLMVRLALKVDVVEALWAKIRRKKYHKSLIDEIALLLGRVHEHEVRSYARQLLGDDSSQLLCRMLFHRRIDTISSIREWTKKTKRTVKPLTRHGGTAARRRKFWRLLLLLKQKGSRFLGGTVSKKQLNTGGAVIAIIGADGTGKSLISRELVEWLSWKLDTKRFYLGHGAESMVTRVFSRILFLNSRSWMRLPQLNVPDRSERSPKLGKRRTEGRFYMYLRKNVRALYRIFLLWERNKKLVMVQRSRAGQIVVTDRYPQDCFEGFFDGPWYSGKSSGSCKLERLAAEKERQVYALARAVPPDIIIRLHVPVEIALARQPGQRRRVEQKVMATRKIFFNNAAHFDVDSSRSVDDVLSEVKCKVWKML